MKISLAWVFDHIDAAWNKQDIEGLVQKFNAVTAEIEGTERVFIDMKRLFMAKHTEGKTVITELSKEPKLDPRGAGAYLVHCDGNDCRWATCKDVGLDKEGLLPAFDVSDKDMKGGWRKQFEHEDILLDVDNKTLTHRPDMWGHRGFAREIAAFLDYNFIPQSSLLAEAEIQNFDKKSKVSDTLPFQIVIKGDKACKRFSGLYFNEITNKPSHMFIASRLIKVGIRPINAIVDLTNYVMLDWSQPVHAYDAAKISGKKLVARMASSGETLELLDGQTLELTKDDLVIADGEKVIGLAGIMGGLEDSIGEDTTSIFFESAHFVAPYIRRTSLRHGVRTESSARFEKTLDPNQITDAIKRFMFLATQIGLPYKVSGDIICVGKPHEEKELGVTHSFLEKRSGVTLERAKIVATLTKLGFQVTDTEAFDGDNADVLYTIRIPSYRGAKDVAIKEDILEEIIRFFGFNKIALELPALQKKPSDLTSLLRMRDIKHVLAHAVGMTEQRNYIYYDEDFLADMGLNFEDCVEIQNPVSETNRRLTTSLMPNLFKNVQQNCVNTNSLRFFESGRTFVTKKAGVVEEKKKLVGIFFEKRKPVDFYACKQHVANIFKICGAQCMTCDKIDAPKRPWLVPYQSAALSLDGTCIGVMGKVDSSFLVKLGALPESEAFCFELDVDALLQYRRKDLYYTPISKFQETVFDLCFMVPLSLTVATLQKTLRESDALITKVDLIDFFDKKEWTDKRSVAFRLWVSHPEKTLQKEEIEAVRNNALKKAEKQGAKLR